MLLGSFFHPSFFHFFIPLSLHPSIPPISLVLHSSIPPFFIFSFLYPSIPPSPHLSSPPFFHTFIRSFVYFLFESFLSHHLKFLSFIQTSSIHPSTNHYAPDTFAYLLVFHPSFFVATVLSIRMTLQIQSSPTSIFSQLHLPFK